MGSDNSDTTEKKGQKISNTKQVQITILALTLMMFNRQTHFVI